MRTPHLAVVLALVMSGCGGSTGPPADLGVAADLAGEATEMAAPDLGAPGDLAGQATDVVFHADWGTATGTSSGAVTDGNRFNVEIGNGALNEVIPATGLDFPTTNVYRCEVAAGNPGPTDLVRYTSLPVPAVGGHLYYRFYTRVVAPDDLADDQTHPIQDGNAAGDSNWMFEVVTRTAGNGIAAGKWRSRILLQAGPTTGASSSISTRT